MPKQKKAIFLDRDGTLIKEIPYLHSPEKIEFETGTISALLTLQNQDYLLIIITNQAGIGREIFTREQYKQTEKALHERLLAKGVHLTKTYFCPHHPLQGKGKYLKDCPNRKPKPGMLLEAIKKYNINPKNSYMIGNNISDIQAGINANVKTILLENPSENPSKLPDYTVKTLNDASKIIISE